MDPILWDWLSFAVRWLHVITGIAWIGSSFYFIALDLGLAKRPGLPQGVGGEAWQVHGGGFYHMQKYTIAPASMPEELTWFKWESYSTWLSGFALMAIIYYAGAELFLIDRHLLDIPVWGAVAISLVCLAAGWIVYDLACRSPLAKNDLALTGVLFVFFVAMGYAFTHLFSGRGAYLHSGAIMATAMTANVFFVIIPNQKKVVADLIAGRTPDPKLGAEAKQRSTHNNYLTLPVIFLMLSNHYPLAFATRFNWLIVALVLVMGVLIRHFFNSMHAGKGRPWWTFAVSAICFAGIVWLSTFPPLDTAEDSVMAPQVQQMVALASFAPARDTVLARCSMCHAAEPLWEGIGTAPKGVMLESEADIARHAAEIYRQAGISHAMPPGNITEITAEERAQLVAWFREGAAAR